MHAFGLWALLATAQSAAHDPRFQDKALWPALDGKESFTAQVWERARLFVWAPTRHERRDAPGPLERRFPGP
jgi:hypothetical protein